MTPSMPFFAFWRYASAIPPDINVFYLMDSLSFAIFQEPQHELHLRVGSHLAIPPDYMIEQYKVTKAAKVSQKAREASWTLSM